MKSQKSDINKRTTNQRKDVNSQKSRSKRNASREKSNKPKKNYDNNSLLSPKTVSYKKIMEKYENLITENSPKETQNEVMRYISTKEKNKENKKKQDQLNIVHQISKINQPLDLNFNYQNEFKELVLNNESLKEENLILKRKLELEKIKTISDIGKPINDEIESNNQRKLSKYERENNEINMKKMEAMGRSQEKIMLFVKICKKYLKKISNITGLLKKIDINTRSSESRDVLLQELTITNEKFFNTINNPQLMSVIYQSNPEKNEDNMLEDLIDDSMFQSQSPLIEVIQSLEKQLKEVQIQNETMRKNENNIDLNYINTLRKNYNELKATFEKESFLNNKRNSKLNDLEEENLKLVKQIKELNEEFTLEIQYFKEKLETIQNELNNKDSIINYLENQLKFRPEEIDYTNQNKEALLIDSNNEVIDDKLFSTNRVNHINPESNMNYLHLNSNNSLSTVRTPNYYSKENLNMKNQNDFRYPNEYEFNNQNQNNHDESFAQKYLNLEKDKILISDQDQEINNELLMSDDNPVINTPHILNSPQSEFNMSKATTLKGEIENLDNEIRHLQGKLKIMIESKKKD